MSSSDECEEITDCKLEDYIISLLDLGKYEEAKSVVKDVKNEEVIHANCPDIIKVLGPLINTDSFENNQDLFECCESLLYHIAEVALPDDSLFEFIELAEKTDEVLFCVMLKCMKISLLKIIDRQVNALSWCLTTIIRHITDLPQTEDFELEGDECALIENTDSSRQLSKVYKDILNFIEPVASHVLSDLYVHNVCCERLKIELVSFLIKLLGRPVVYMNLESHKSPSEFRLIAERIVYNVKKFKWELTHFLNFVSSYRPKKKETVSDVIDLDFNNLSLGVFYYLIFKEEVGLDYISFVYNPFFLLEMNTTLVLELLAVENSRAQNKGLLLLESILPRISDSSLDLDEVNGELFGKLSEVLSNVMIYSNIRENRQITVKLFRSLLFKFDAKGRYYILYNIQTKVNQPNFIGYIITITKDLTVEAMDSRDPIQLEYFAGRNLCSILSKFCSLHKGAESDLIELSDRIIAALNFVRFILIRDKEDITRFSEFIPKLEKDFLKPLETGLSLSVAHYKLEKSELVNTPVGEKCTLTLGGIQLPSLSNDQKLTILETALTTFDVIHSLVARVNECLDEFKLAMYAYKTTS